MGILAHCHSTEAKFEVFKYINPEDLVKTTTNLHPTKLHLQILSSYDDHLIWLKIPGSINSDNWHVRREPEQTQTKASFM